MNQSEVASRGVARIVRQNEGRSVRWGPAGVIRILAGAESTDGSFSICEATEQPGSEAPLHIHHAEAEAFYVLDGEIELTCGEQTITASAGDFVYAPRDVPHKYIVVGQHRPACCCCSRGPGSSHSSPRPGHHSTSRPQVRPTPRSSSASSVSTTWSYSRRRDTDGRTVRTDEQSRRPALAQRSVSEPRLRVRRASRR
jgi:mannose-6-phosphate isomerase-like protein (cupin superfamily)